VTPAILPYKLGMIMNKRSHLPLCEPMVPLSWVTGSSYSVLSSPFLLEPKTAKRIKIEGASRPMPALLSLPSLPSHELQVTNQYNGYTEALQQEAIYQAKIQAALRRLTYDEIGMTVSFSSQLGAAPVTSVQETSFLGATTSSSGWKAETTLVANKRTENWNARFRELIAFHEEHDHLRVPQAQPGGLGKWVSRQRQMKQEVDSGSREPTTEVLDRISRLDAVGFEWSPGCGLVSWETRFLELLDYKKKHGHCNVPQRDHGPLGKWVDTQRQTFRDVRNGKRKMTSKTQARLDKLELVGFQWSARIKRLDSTEKRE